MMTTASAKALSSPATLFIFLWRLAEAWDGAQRARAERSDMQFGIRANQALDDDPADRAHDRLLALIGNEAGREDTYRGELLGLMQAIDEKFLLVHPRTPLISPSAGHRAHIPDWLRDLRDERILSGSYAVRDGLALIARGPLLRGSRSADATSADSLADRFTALAVVPTVLDHDGRTITIGSRTISTSVSRGIAPRPSPGAETVAFVPVAELDEDIILSERVSHGQGFVDVQLRSTLDPTNAILDALARCDAVDIALVPEFMVSETQADAIAVALSSGLPSAPRLLIAGSGATRIRSGQQAWNEARALNSCGTELWRQRKIWPAGITRDRTAELGLSDPGPAGQIFEDTAAGDRVEVVDADGLGRCVIFICQDIQTQPLANEVVRKFQPDWIFTPIFDKGVATGRWMHTRCFELSGLSQARFLVVSSTAWAHKIGNANAACGLAIGPKEPTNYEDASRATVIVGATRGRGIVTVQWRNGNWVKTSVS